MARNLLNSSNDIANVISTSKTKSASVGSLGSMSIQNSDNVTISGGKIKSVSLDKIKAFNITDNKTTPIGMTMKNYFNNSVSFGLKTQQNKFYIINEDDNNGYPKLVIDAANKRISINYDNIISVPTATFHIVSVNENVPSVIIDESKASNSKSANIILTSKFNSWEIGNSALNKVGFYIDKLNGNKDIFFINNNNLVGIGTNMPQSKLNVIGNVAIGGLVTAPANGLYVNGSVGIGIPVPKNKMDIAGNLIIGSSFASNKFAPVDGLTVEGSISIGKDNPVNKLDIFGNSAIGTLYACNKVAPENGLIVQGNVGIGTFEPNTDFKLHVKGNVKLDGTLTVSGTTTVIDQNITTSEQLLVTNDGTGPALIVNQIGNQDIVLIKDDDNNVFIIKDGGNVGIGTDIPQNRLDISGSLCVGTNFAGVNTAPINGLLTQGNIIVNDKFIVQSINGNTKTFGDLEVVKYTTLNETEIITNDGNLNIHGTNKVLLQSSYNNSNSINIYTEGGANEMITISSTLGTLSNSININSLLGGITNSAKKNIYLLSTFDSSNAIKLETNGGINEQIFINSKLGTNIDSIKIKSDNGGININALTNINIQN